jgi:hypothetical protein
MPRWSVQIPVSGYVEVEVEASSKDEAIDVGMQQEVGSEDIVEWETLRHVTQGNVFYGVLAEADAQEV